MATLARLRQAVVPLAVRSYASASASARLVQRDYISERRRAANKSALKLAEDPNAPLLRFPDERLGNHYALNFALNFYGITPLGDAAYRNLHARHLAMLVDARADKASKALKVEAAKDDAITTLFVEGLEGSTLSLTHWRKVMAAVTRHLSESGQLFVRDASSGTLRSSQVNVRAVTTSALADLTLQSALLPAPGTVDSFQHEVVLMHAPELTLADAGRYGLKGSGPTAVHSIIKGDQVLATLSPQEKQRISQDDQQRLMTRETIVTVVFGTASLVALRRVLAASLNLVHARKSRVTLPSAALIAANKGALAVLDPTSSLPRSLPVLASGGALWSKDGFSAAFADRVSISASAPSASPASTSLPSSPFESLMETLSDGKVRIAERLASARSAYALAPVALVLLVRDQTKALPALSRLASNTAAALATSSLVGVPAAQKSALLAQIGQTPSYAINASLLSESEISAALSAIGDGTAQSAALTPLKEIEAGAVTKLKGIEDAKLSASQSDKAALAALAKTLA